FQVIHLLSHPCDFCSRPVDSNGLLEASVFLFVARFQAGRFVVLGPDGPHDLADSPEARRKRALS
ncbi:hypothetical protein ABQF86_03360, partial [Xanthomonas campestris]|uniref:hypothetical protein n=1 Tax=Xanthomonas campestris TaxID=339 RepID=UPI0032E4944F